MVDHSSLHPFHSKATVGVMPVRAWLLLSLFLLPCGTVNLREGSWRFIVIRDDLNNMTRERTLGGVMSQFLTKLTSTTAKMVKARGLVHRGPMGNDIGFIQDLDNGQGGHYSGYDEAPMVTPTDASVGYRAEWGFAFADAAMAGTNLKKNAGVTTEQLMEGAGNLADLGDRSVIQVASMTRTALSRAMRTIANLFETDIWGIRESEDPYKERAKPTIPQLMDYRKSWLGVPPDGFDEWDQTDVWRNAPVSTLSVDDGKYFRNVPQWFGASALRDLEVEVLEDVANAMCERINGVWACPCNRTFFNSLTKKIREQGTEQQFIRYGGGDYSHQTRVVKINRMYFYLDSRAPSDKIYCLHVGEEGIEDILDEHASVGFGVCFWAADDMWDLMDQIQEEMYIPKNMMGTAVADLIGVDRSIPVEPRKWRMAENTVDAVYMRILTQWAIVGQRWKNAVIDKLQVT